MTVLKWLVGLGEVKEKGQGPHYTIFTDPKSEINTGEGGDYLPELSQPLHLMRFFTGFYLFIYFFSIRILLAELRKND